MFGWFRKPRLNHVWIVFPECVESSMSWLCITHKVLSCSTPRIVWEHSQYNKLIVCLCGPRVFYNFSHNQPSNAWCTAQHLGLHSIPWVLWVTVSPRSFAGQNCHQQPSGMFHQVCEPPVIRLFKEKWGWPFNSVVQPPGCLDNGR